MLLCRGASIRHLTPTRQRLNIERRFKWAFQDDEDPARPDVGEYERICVKLSEKRVNIFFTLLESEAHLIV
jgi:hypothetical protein